VRGRGAVEAVAVVVDGDHDENRQIGCGFKRGVESFARFVQRRHRLDAEKVDAVFGQNAHLFGERGAGFVEAGFAERFKTNAERTHGAGDPSCDLGAAGLLFAQMGDGLAGDAHPSGIDVGHLGSKAMAREAKAVGAEGVGFKNLRAGLQIFLVNGEDQRRIGEIELVVAAADGHAAAIEHCAHGAVGEKGTTSEDVGERGHPVVMLRQPGGARQQTGLLCYTSGVKSGIASDSGRCAKRSAMRKSRSRSSRHGCGELRAKPSR
jgi:hypothetical protein